MNQSYALGHEGINTKSKDKWRDCHRKHMTVSRKSGTKKSLFIKFILSIVNSDWLQHAHSVRGVYESISILLYTLAMKA